jgi:hypothetical protein|tara:strand:- start:2031 stop:2519 length:489 start_codon:yes stop_codon:yes gene_type:complete
MYQWQNTNIQSIIMALTSDPLDNALSSSAQTKVLVATLEAEFGEAQIQYIDPNVMEYYEDQNIKSEIEPEGAFNDEDGLSSILSISKDWFSWFTYLPLGAHGDQHKGWVKVMSDGSSVYGMTLYGAECYAGGIIYVRVKPGESDKYREVRELRNQALKRAGG